jgi:WD40 repeat protein
MADTAVDADVVRDSIKERVRSLGAALGQATPTGMMVVLAGATLWPIVAPLVGAGAVATMATAAVGLLSGPGQEFISGFLKRVAGREDPKDELEAALGERLAAGDEDAVALREDVSRLLRSVGGVESALAAADADVKDALARGFAELSGTWQEFGWMLGEVQDRLHEIQARQAEGLALQREGLELQREQLVKTTLLLQLHGAPARSPPGVEPREAPADVACPYKGLRAFQPEDAAFFFGREALVADVLARLAEARFVAVVGASGSGKSSFVRAGLVAAIWRGALPAGMHARVITLTPGERPLEQLAMRLALLQGVSAGSVLDDLRTDPERVVLAARQALVDAPPDARLVLVIDQFEELFTLCHDEVERRLFVDALLHARGPGNPTLVVLAVRADFYGRFAAFPALAAAVQDHQALVGRMTQADLRRAIEQPAAEAGLVLEPGLAESMLDDLGEEPGALPLLSHALLETFERRSGHTLTLAGYVESGGVRGAIAKTAETVFDGLDPAQQAIARRVFLDLTEIGDASEPTRRPVNRSEVADAPTEDVIDVLADARLITVGEDTVQVAHEALIRYWPTLRHWLEENRESLRLRRRLTQAASEWDALDHDPGALYRGARLAATADWAEREDLAPREREFLEASRAAEEAELSAARRRARRLRAVAAGLSVLVLATAASAVLALRERDRAREQEQVAQSRQLASEAQARAQSDPELAALLALEAHGMRKTIDSRVAALSMLVPLERAAGSLPESRNVMALAMARDSRALATIDTGGNVQVWDLRTLRRRGPAFAGSDVPPDVFSANVAISPDGTRVASGGTDGRIRLWRVGQDPARVPPLAKVRGGALVAFSPDGRLLAGAGGIDNRVRLWDAGSGRPLGRPFAGFKNAGVSAMAFSPDGKTIAIEGLQFPMRLWDVATRRPVGPPFRGGDSAAASLAFSGDGKILAAGEGSGRIWLWDVATGRRLGPAIPAFDDAMADSVTLNDDGSLLAAGGGGEVQLWSVPTRRALGPPLEDDAPEGHVAFSADGKTLAYTGEDGQVLLWDPAPGRALDRPLPHGGPVDSVAFSADGKLLAAVDEAVTLWDRASRSAVDRFEGINLTALSFSPDGSLLAVAGWNNEIRFYDVTARRLLPQRLLFGEVPVFGLAFSPDGRQVAGASDRVEIRDVRTGQPVGAPFEGVKNANSVAFSPDGKRLAAADSDRAVIWDLATRDRRTLPASVVQSVAFSPDGTILATGGLVGRLWDTATGRPLGQPLRGDTVMESVAFTPDGKTLATGDADVRLWDVASRRELGPPLTSIDFVSSVAFSPDGKQLAAGGIRTERQPFDGPGALRLWDSVLWTDSLPALRERLCPAIGRNLTTPERQQFLPEEPRRETCPR